MRLDPEAYGEHNRRRSQSAVAYAICVSLVSRFSLQESIGPFLIGLTSLVGMILVIVFFVTSSDSVSLVIDTIAAQAMSLSTALPFTFVLLGACYAVFRGLMDEVR